MIVYFLIGVLVAAVLVLWLFRARGTRVSAADKQRIYSAWQAVRELQQGDDHAMAKAIIEADKILDNCLQMVGIAGATMGERLKNSRGYIRNIDSVWKAHKLRNQLTHELDARAYPREVHAAIKEFEIAIKQLGLL